MFAPIESLNKKQIVWLNRNKCKHSHKYLNHFECFRRDHGYQERIGVLDIETSDLKADFGYIFSYCIKALNGKIYHRILTPEEIRNGVFDRDLLKQFIEDCSHFDRFVTYFGTYFDMPFLRTRALKMNLDYPKLDTIKHTDMWAVIKKKFKLRNNRLQTACTFFEIESKGHPMYPEQWNLAKAGHQKSLNFILTHNKEDVVSTEKLYHKVFGHFKLTDTSI